MPSVFDSPDALRAICAPPADPSSEPEATFPLAWYEAFLREIGRLGISIITYRDIFDSSDDWDHRSNFEREFEHWNAHVREPGRTYLLIQHDVDNHPFFTKRMVAMEAVYGVRSNIFIFRDRYSRRRDEAARYDVDHEFFQQAERHGFVIGYHQNAFALVGFDMARAIERYRSDVEHLRSLYDIRFVVPHGGVGREIDGVMVHNHDVPVPPELEGNIRWVFNRYAPRVSDRWSDGGLRKTTDPERIRGFDIIGEFLRKLRPGTRNRCLIHPQRWGYNVDASLNPALAEAAWYRKVCRKYAGLAVRG